MRYAIYGAGSLGTVLGAFLTKNGIPVELVNHNRAHVEALRANGAHITGTMDFTVPVRAVLPEEMDGPYDIVFLMTKQPRNAETVSFLAPMLAPGGVLVTLQNGLPEPGIAAILGPERTVGCTVEWGATLTEPGVCVLTSDPGHLSFHMGGMPDVPEETLSRVKTVLEHMCPVEMEENFLGVRWSKLLINATFSGIGTAVGGTFGDVSGNRKNHRVAVRCIRECVDVGRSAGAVFAPVQGIDIVRLFYWRGPLKRAVSELLIRPAMRRHTAIYPSMLQDIRRGRQCEIDAINGVVCACGRRSGVPTPINDRIVRIVKDCESGALQPRPENIRLFDDLL